MTDGDGTVSRSQYPLSFIPVDCLDNGTPLGVQDVVSLVQITSRGNAAFAYSPRRQRRCFLEE